VIDALCEITKQAWSSLRRSSPVSLGLGHHESAPPPNSTCGSDGEGQNVPAKLGGVGHFHDEPKSTGTELEITFDFFVFGRLVHTGVAYRGCGEVPRGEKILYSRTDPESHITEYTLVYGGANTDWLRHRAYG